MIAVTAGVLKQEQEQARDAGGRRAAQTAGPTDSWWPCCALATAHAAPASAPSRAPPLTRSAQPATLPAIAGIDAAHVAQLARNDSAFPAPAGWAGGRGARRTTQVRAIWPRAPAPRLPRSCTACGVAANVGALALAASIHAGRRPAPPARASGG